MSIKPLLGWPLEKNTNNAAAEPQQPAAEQLAAANQEIARLRKINAALIERVESGKLHSNEAYAAFRHSVVLAEQVRERTDELTHALTQLKASNSLLTQERHKAEVAHQHLVDAIESISDGFVLFDQQQRIILFNRHFKSFWARHGNPISTGIHLAEAKRIIERSGLVKETQRSGAQRMLYRLSSGRWLQVTERPTLEGGLVILYTDITELKLREQLQREQALAQKTVLLQQTVDNLSQGVAMVNSQGVLELWNHRFLELYGLADIAPNTLFTELMQTQCALNLPNELATCAQSEQRLTDGRMLDICVHALPEGSYVATFTDITERYEHAEALRKSENWIRLITDHVPAMIAYVRRDLSYEFLNKVYEEWYDWPRGTAIGLPLSEVHNQQHMTRLEPYIRRALAGESLTFEVAETDKRGHTCFMQRSYVPNRQADGQVVGIFVLVRDITQRRRTAEALHQAYQNLELRVAERTAELTQLNQQLVLEIQERRLIETRLLEAKREAEEANLSKTKFLAAVSHDLLQPLNAARLFTGALVEQLQDSRYSHLMRNIGNSLDDVENLLGTLVDISKLDAGVIKADLAAFAINDLLENLAAEYRQLASSVGLGLSFVPSTAVVNSDIHLLARILRNFLTNAIRYTEHGRLLLGCRRVPGALLIQVWDTGVGIAPHKQQEIFQEFKRGDWHGAQHDRGLGLGLAIVDKISRILNHPVAVRSSLGQGSCFSIKVPLARTTDIPLVSELELPTHSLNQLQGAKVWVLDNDPAICQAMQTLLGEWGCEVHTGLSKTDLAQQVGGLNQPVDLLIADYHLDHDVNGLDVVLEINQERQQPVAALMITANYSKELKQEMRQLGYTLLHKPVKPMRLKITMGHLLEQQRQV
ncbi:PAS domain-containing hybrid sensor histidine kinase/response regulator [Thiopseudomonas alkaliphila]|uniref:PAS domain-containing hybrid sensor histidine kinase/response regulator n=1 Tax=Thiopseudomonas alkaliphila TaxID=1697053 RepID=UPI0009B9CF31|nr:PAS domain-containing hybrid sensor histidine kinase/response regulator [Thiopseudomonas alkaliphila]